MKTHFPYFVEFKLVLPLGTPLLIDQ